MNTCGRISIFNIFNDSRRAGPHGVGDGADALASRPQANHSILALLAGQVPAVQVEGVDVVLDIIVLDADRLLGAGNAQVGAGPEAISAIETFLRAVHNPVLEGLAHASGGDVGLEGFVLLASEEGICFGVGMERDGVGHAVWPPVFRLLPGVAKMAGRDFLFSALLPSLRSTAFPICFAPVIATPSPPPA